MAGDTIKSFVRVRPLTLNGGAAGPEMWVVRGTQVEWLGAANMQPSEPFSFDGVFPGSSRTADVYQAVKPMIVKVVDGFNATVLAYGQTNSGKTHTMMGSTAEPGIVPMALDELFQSAAACFEREFAVRVSYVELYNDDIYDLGAEGMRKLKVTDKRHEKDKDRVVAVTVQGVREEIFDSADKALKWLHQGNRRRRAGETSMNSASSRSHAVCRIVVESKRRDDAGDKV